MVMTAIPAPAPSGRNNYNFSEFAAKGFSVDWGTNGPPASIGVQWCPWKQKPTLSLACERMCLIRQVI